MYNKTEIGRIAQQHGFVRDTFEKVLHLKDVLNYLNEEEYLRDHLLLKEIVERIKEHPMAIWKCQQ